MGAWEVKMLHEVGDAMCFIGAQANQVTTQQSCRQLAPEWNYSVKIKLLSDPSFTREYKYEGGSLSAYHSLLKSGYAGGVMGPSGTEPLG